IADDANDADLGSAGPLLLPDLVDAGGVTRHLAIVSGKDGAIYIASRDNLGQYNAMGDNIYQELPNAGRNFSSPAYFNGRVYIGPAGSALRAYSVSQAMLGRSPSSQSAHTFGGVGTVPSISANGNANGIVWALDGGAKTLYAFDAEDLTRLLYSS